MKPIRVKIVTPNELLTAGRPTPIRCETWGSYPPAKVTWLLDGEPIRQGDVTVSSEGVDSNLTASILTLRVGAENDGAELTCRSSNPWFSNGALEDKRRMSVACKSWHDDLFLELDSFEDSIKIYFPHTYVCVKVPLRHNKSSFSDIFFYLRRNQINI